MVEEGHVKCVVCAAAVAVLRRLRGKPAAAADGGIAADGGGDRRARRRCALRSEVLPNRRWTGPTGGLRGAGWLALAWIWAPFGFALLLLVVVFTASRRGAVT